MTNFWKFRCQKSLAYLKIRSLDIGTDVKKGQIMAEIDTPELDQQLAEAEATLVQAQANVQNAEAIYKKSLTAAGKFSSRKVQIFIDQDRSNSA